MSNEVKAAIIGGIAVIITATVGYFTAIAPVQLSIEATKRAEARPTATLTPTKRPSPTSTPTATTSLPTSPVMIRTVGDNCLDVPDGITGDGVLVQVYKCHGGKNQLWTLTSNGEIRTLVGNKCLDIRDSLARNGTLVQLYECDGNTSQQWIFTPSDEIRVLGDRCLEVRLGGWKGVEPTPRLFGTPVELYQCNGGDIQKWSIVRQ